MTESRKPLHESWNEISPELSSEYLDGYGYPSTTSKVLLSEVIKREFGRAPRVLDVGCGNGQLLKTLREACPDILYTGIDISHNLLEAARRAYAKTDGADWINCELSELTARGDRRYDCVVFSHVLEMLESPQRALVDASRLADVVVVRWFEPPDSDVDVVELRKMALDRRGVEVPYIRWTMARDYYQLCLRRIGALRVDVYRDESSVDQVHVIHLGRGTQ
jgi:ubiquinone/menaquinone biosynthesis C-methylase UbiE